MSTSLPYFSRREFFRVAGASSLALGFDGLRGFAQEKQPAPLAALNRFPRTVQEWYVEQVRAAEKIGEEAYVKGVREKIAKYFGPFPEKTPLNAKVTGTLVRDAYSIEKVVF